MDTVFLLGSGTSIDAGMPRVSTITDQILSGDGVFLHTNKRFVLDASNPNYESRRSMVEPVLELVEDLRQRAAAYFDRRPNYEELAQVVRQINDALSKEYESPAVMPLVDLLSARPYAAYDSQQLHGVSQLAHHYIMDTVRQMLDKPPSRLDHLAVIVEACTDLPGVLLATLNHDLVLESALRRADIDYGDGFEAAGRDIRLWTDEWDDVSVRLLKLHGSLDWWGYRRMDEPSRGWVTTRYLGDDPTHPNSNVVVGPPQDMRPIFLTGTFDKVLAYETWIFPDQHLRFHETLREAKHVVVIGYGFGDKAINTRLIGWLARSSKHKLIVCHPDPVKLSERSRPAIREKWTGWQNRGQVKTVVASVADLDYAAIVEHLT
jgi:hypothetical protein